MLEIQIGAQRWDQFNEEVYHGVGGEEGHVDGGQKEEDLKAAEEE